MLNRHNGRGHEPRSIIQYWSPQAPVEEPESANLKIARNREAAGNMTSVGLEDLTLTFRLRTGPVKQDRWSV